MEITINDDNLTLNEINEYNSKVRAILVDEQNQVLICNYGGVYLLPGGTVDNGENLQDAITRELLEELGQHYSEQELTYFSILKYFQKNYPTRNGTFSNRLIETHYFIGKYKSVSNSKQKLSEKEIKGNFRLELVPLEELEQRILENKTNNPRNIYFQKEILSILSYYKNIKSNKCLKRSKKK